jgi:hypothetical protein
MSDNTFAGNVNFPSGIAAPFFTAQGLGHIE